MTRSFYYETCIVNAFFLLFGMIPYVIYAIYVLYKHINYTKEVLISGDYRELPFCIFIIFLPAYGLYRLTTHYTV